jgi:hypothetical protein
MEMIGFRVPFTIEAGRSHVPHRQIAPDEADLSYALMSMSRED